MWTQFYLWWVFLAAAYKLNSTLLSTLPDDETWDRDVFDKPLCLLLLLFSVQNVFCGRNCVIDVSCKELYLLCAQVHKKYQLSGCLEITVSLQPIPLSVLKMHNQKFGLTGCAILGVSALTVSIPHIYTLVMLARFVCLFVATPPFEAFFLLKSSSGASYSRKGSGCKFLQILELTVLRDSSIYLA